MTALEPGLYRATVRGVADKILVVKDHSIEVIQAGSVFSPGHVSDPRPLIVLDLEDPATVVAALRHAAPFVPNYHVRDSRIQDLADQIEAQTKPARIPEPGLWGVVTAGTSGGRVSLVYAWVRTGPDGNVWVRQSDGNHARWSDLIDPTLIRGGLS